MSIFLDEILDHKKRELSGARVSVPIEDLVEQCKSCPPVRPFLSALKAAHGKTALIAEVKKASPSAGVIRANFNYLEIAAEYSAAGAQCLSVLTDERFFQGKLSYLTEIKAAVQLPLLRKDFIIDPYQIYESRAAGADAILLIVAALDTGLLTDLYKLGRKLGMDVLVETHTESEMIVASSLNADLIGINSRDLKSFVTDLSAVETVAKLAPPSALIVAESGIKTATDVARLRSYGVHAFLIGETLMRSENIASAVAELFK